MITYKEDKNNVKVYLAGKYVGRIMTVNGKYTYFPKNSVRHGDLFDTLSACKQSLEAD